MLDAKGLAGESEKKNHRPQATKHANQKSHCGFEIQSILHQKSEMVSISVQIKKKCPKKL